MRPFHYRAVYAPRPATLGERARAALIQARAAVRSSGYAWVETLRALSLVLFVAGSALITIGLGGLIGAHFTDLPPSVETLDWLLKLGVWGALCWTLAGLLMLADD